MIKVKWAVLCHHVETSPEGGRNLVGVAEDYTSATLPLNIDQLTVVLCTELSGGTNASIVLRLVHNGHVLYATGPSANQLAVEGNKQIVRRKYIPVHFGAVLLPEFGDYALDVLVNGQKVHSSPFRLLQLKTF